MTIQSKESSKSNAITRNRKFKIGEVYLMPFGEGANEFSQKGIRPGVVFQNNTGNIYSPNIVALPLTSSIKKTSMPTHVYIPASDAGLRKDSMVLCENPECISRESIGSYLTTIPEEYMEKIAMANILASSAISYISPSALLSLRQQAISLNAVG